MLCDDIPNIVRAVAAKDLNKPLRTGHSLGRETRSIFATRLLRWLLAVAYQIQDRRVCRLEDVSVKRANHTTSAIDLPCCLNEVLSFCRIFWRVRMSRAREHATAPLYHSIDTYIPAQGSHAVGKSSGVTGRNTS